MADIVPNFGACPNSDLAVVLRAPLTMYCDVTALFENAHSDTVAR